MARGLTIPVTLPGVNTVIRINRAELESTMRPALLDTVAALRRTLASAHTAPDELSAIVLVGGSSQIPLVSELLQQEFAAALNIDTHPKHDIALGAALLCHEPATETAESATEPGRPSATTAPVESTASVATIAPEAGLTPDIALAVSVSEPPASASEPPKRRRRKALLAGVAALVVVISVVLGVLAANSRSHNNTSGGSSAAPSIEVTGTPSVDELMSHIPSDYRNTCQPIPHDLRGEAVKIGCNPSDPNIKSVTHWQYASAAAFKKAVGDDFGHGPVGDCWGGPGEGPYDRELPDGRRRSGQFLCQDSDGAMVMIATTDQLRVISVVETDPSSSWGYAELRGAWEEHPLG